MQSITTGDNNAALGYQSLQANTTGSGNVANGYQALYSNTTGNYNTANGYQNLYTNTTGGWNVANGYKALYSNTTGNNNMGNGYQALYLNTTGGGNIANSYQALYSNVNGDNNIADGQEALYSNTDGSHNIGIGLQSGYANVHGSYNIAIGYQANFSSNSLTNAIAIGKGATVDASNKIQLGNSSVTAVQLGTGTNVTLQTGAIKITGGTLGDGKVLTSDANGLASWKTPGQTGGLKTLDSLPDQNLTLTATQMTNGTVLYQKQPNNTSRTITTATAANIVAAIPNAQVGSWFEFTLFIEQQGNLNNNTGVTLFGDSNGWDASTMGSRTFSCLGIVTNPTQGSEAVTIYRK